MAELTVFLAMGGYAAYVWPAFALTLMVLGGLAAVSLRGLRAREAELRALEIGQGSRRARGRAAATEAAP